MELEIKLYNASLATLSHLKDKMIFINTGIYNGKPTDIQEIDVVQLVQKYAEIGQLVMDNSILFYKIIDDIKANGTIVSLSEEM